MPSSIVLIILCLMLGFSCTVDRTDDRCEIVMKKIISKNKETSTDNTALGLHFTWVSQECEVRAGPKYITRKYSFYKNGTFLLLQFYYAEDSCSIATYNVVARGSIQILSPSISVSGATTASIELDSVQLIPLNRQVAHKFAHRMNASCGGTDTKWRPYLAQLIYERPVHPPLDTGLQMYDLASNSLQSRLPRTRRRYTLSCLESFGIEFTELTLLRIETRRSSDSGGPVFTWGGKVETRVDLFLGGLARNVHSQKTEARPDRMQATSLVRADTIISCPICGNVLRATEYSPPLFHQAPSFPAVIGGHWISVKCESVDGGVWSKRFFRLYSGYNKWFARWTYYKDSGCSNSLYTVAAAGTYVQRAIRQTRDVERFSAKIFSNASGLDRLQEDLELRLYRRIFHETEESIKPRGYLRQKKVKIDRQRYNSRISPLLLQKEFMVPRGTTLLELQVSESLINPSDKVTPSRCSARSARGKRCASRNFQISATLMFKAKISLDWNGDSILLLASWKDDVWEAPLYRCSETISRYFRHPWQGFPSRSQKDNNWHKRLANHGQYRFSSSLATCFSLRSPLVNWTAFLFWLCWVYLVFL